MRLFTHDGFCQRSSTLLGAALVLALALPALAQSPSPKDRAIAKQHFERGKAAFEVKDYPTAAMAYTQAYEIMPLPGLLFNIAQCYRNLQKHPEAVALFRRYLQEAPEANNRAAVERLISEIEAKLGESQPEKTDDPAIQAEPNAPATQSAAPPSTAPEQQTETKPPRPVPTEAEVTAAGRPDPRDPRDQPTAAPLYTRWWFWTAIGVVVAGGVTATILATQKGSPDVAPSRFPTWQLPEIR